MYHHRLISTATINLSPFSSTHSHPTNTIILSLSSSSIFLQTSINIHHQLPCLSRSLCISVFFGFSLEGCSQIILNGPTWSVSYSSFLILCRKASHFFEVYTGLMPFFHVVFVFDRIFKLKFWYFGFGYLICLVLEWIALWGFLIRIEDQKGQESAYQGNILCHLICCSASPPLHKQFPFGLG